MKEYLRKNGIRIGIILLAAVLIVGLGAATMPVRFWIRPVAPPRTEAPIRIRKAAAATTMPIRTPYFFRYAFKGSSLPVFSAFGPVCKPAGP